MSMESIYEYGSRVGAWRILREFEQRKLPLTVFGVAVALKRHPELTAAFLEQGHEIACHGLRWLHYQNMDIATERAHLEAATSIIKDLTKGQWPLDGTPGATAQTHASWSSSTEATNTTVITMVMIYLFGRKSPNMTVQRFHISSFLTL